MEYWKVGELECWSSGWRGNQNLRDLQTDPNIPLLHYSITPLRLRTVMICFVLLALLFGECVQEEKVNENILMGKLTMDDVYRACPKFRQPAEEYEPDEDVVQRLRALDRHILIKVFLGTWCSDSEEHVPPFDRLMRAVEGPNFEVEYYGVDREKSDGLGLAQSYNIRYVPTFIIFEKGREIGRIVETPKVSVGEDLLEILGR
ncbi:MAG: thioredoxin family protein [bacterium]